MLKSKVTCWFCNKDAHVFVLNRNSWTCEHCDQYNGFKKDGDYNKVIPEMTKEVNSKTYCVNNLNRRHQQHQYQQNNSSILCDRCNQNQELKLVEMKKFEANLNDKSEEEYELYKKKLDHIYDLCRPCKSKLASHLRQLDQQIGQISDLKHRGTQAPLSKANTKSNTRISTITSTTKDFNTPNPSINNQNNSNKPFLDLYELCDNFKMTFKKAYTIAGSSPSSSTTLLAKKSTSTRKTSKNDNSYEISPAKSISIVNEKTDNNANHTSATTTKSSSTKSITCSSFMIVLEDFFIYICVLLVFACDLVNLLNDSGVLMNNTNTNNEWFQTLLTIYKQVLVLIVGIIGCAVHLAYKRPKISRFLMLLGFLFNLVIHMNMFDFTHEEQYIIEVFLSFFLVFYLSIARIYNFFQLVRYV